MTPSSDAGLEAAVGAPSAAYLEELTRRLEHLLGDDLAGVYLLGSAALRDFAAERSDLDVAVVCRGPLSPGEKQQVVASLSHEALPCPAKGLELVLYAIGSLHRPPGPAFELDLNTGAATEQRVSLDFRSEPRHWFVLDVAVGRDHGKRLFGPPARELLPPIPRELVLTALEELLAWYAEKEPVAPSRLLNACRAWRFVEESVWSSKSDASRWARDRLPDSAVIDEALELRGSGVRLDGAREQTEALLTRVSATIAKARRVEHEVRGPGRLRAAP